LVKNELEKVREWAVARIKAGDVPDWSWDQHVKLIEAADALLHDMSVAGGSSRQAQRFGRNFRLVERASGAQETMRIAKAGALH